MNVRPVTSTLALLFLLPLLAWAQDGTSVTQRLTIEVKPITKIGVTGDPGSLLIMDATRSSDVQVVSDKSSKYSMLTNLDNMKIVASINNPMPSGTKLMLQLESSRGLSDGLVDVSNAMSPVEVVKALGKGSDLNQTITYTFAADASVGQINSDSRVITLTLTN
jgi:hypothetical protein